MILRFNDGISFNTEGPYRVEHRSDGYYVVGHGRLCAVDSYEEGQKLIQKWEKNV